MKPLVVPCALLLCAATAGTPPVRESVPEVPLTQVATPAAASVSPSATATPLPSPTATATALTCGEPTRAQLARAAVSIASHPGTIRGAVLVPAATTASGHWSVIAVARDYATDAGRASGLSRDTGLVSADGASLVGLSGSDGWSAVHWPAPLLAAGKRAERTALACLLAKVPVQPGEAGTPAR